MRLAYNFKFFTSDVFVHKKCTKLKTCAFVKFIFQVSVSVVLLFMRKSVVTLGEFLLNQFRIRDRGGILL